VTFPVPSLTYRPAWLRDCSGARLVVIGADGFIGSHVVALALAAGARVRAICLREPWRLEGVEVDPELPDVWWEVDVGEAGVVALLAYEPPPSYEPESWRAHERAVNVRGAEAVAGAGVRVVFASSADVYGAWHDEPVSEAVAPAPATPYAEAKLAAENEILRAGGGSLVLRLATVYGPSEHLRRAIPAFITALAAGDEPVVHGDGSDFRDYVYVGDVAAAIVHACAGGARGRINIGSGAGRSTLDILEAVGAVLEVDPRARFEPSPRPPSRLVLDAAQARAELAFEPRRDFATALREEADWLVATRRLGRTAP
jgi:UDP-glucose 4-epimerase